MAVSWHSEDALQDERRHGNIIRPQYLAFPVFRRRTAAESDGAIGVALARAAPSPTSPTPTSNHTEKQRNSSQTITNRGLKVIINGRHRANRNVNSGSRSDLTLSLACDSPLRRYHRKVGTSCVAAFSCVFSQRQRVSCPSECPHGVSDADPCGI